MIISEIKGGLGNQLFQYAFGRCLAEQTNTELKLDISFFDSIDKGVTHRQYLLDRFAISAVIATTSEIQALKKRSLIDKLFPYTAKYLKDKERKFSSRYFKRRDNRYLTGYWQSEKYFKPIEQIIRNEFELKNISSSENLSQILSKIDTTTSVSIHFRRTDYIGKTVGAVCTQKYYDNAIAKMQELIGDDIHLFIFSDDIDWVRNNVNFPVASTIVEGVADIDDCVLDLYVMSRCKHNIIANSSFSWWGAWLNSNLNKTVICPDVWEPGRNIDLIAPKEWNRMVTK